MADYLLIFISTAVVNNVVLGKFLGLCPFMGVSNKIDSALGMGLATTFVLCLAAIAAWLIEALLLAPLGIQVMRILVLILVIAAVVQLTELIIQKNSPELYQALGIFLPLITTNCAVLGVALLVVQNNMKFLQTLCYAFGSAAGFSLVIVLFAGLRQRLKLAKVPAAFAGLPIAFITAGLLSMAFLGFSGLVN
ncbi:electron transport complex subunit RsxA [Agarivorans albus]|uniref:Ion-translocating oxidoreductase complex subunit A n=1 Tax=Agarivorans albus MKT 106 TaxID=1331007 RepID=R9PKG8_AGAAL|nr:electron transport complex subunit RsxA [Agarivorans albus]GAD01758.1 electron transport complex protein RnfA [Agarivorans albus MKT 106]